MRFAISKPKFGLCKIECVCVCTDCLLSCLLYFVCRWPTHPPWTVSMAQAALCDITPQTRIPTLLIVFWVQVLLLVGRCEFRPNNQLARAVHQRNRNMGDNGGPSSAARATKRPAESAPDAAALCAFAEHAFGLWRLRVPGEVLGRKVAALTMRMTAHGYNAPQLAGQMKEELQLSIDLGDVMDLVVAWEDVNGVEYDPGQKMFKQAQTAATTATSGLKVKQESSEWLEMKTRIESLERELAQAQAGRETSSRRVPWGDRPLTEETIDAFLCEEEGVPEWMQEALDLVKMAISDMGEDSVSAVPAVDLWRLVT